MVAAPPEIEWPAMTAGPPSRPGKQAGGCGQPRAAANAAAQLLPRIFGFIAGTLPLPCVPQGGLPPSDDAWVGRGLAGAGAAVLLAA